MLLSSSTQICLVILNYNLKAASEALLVLFSRTSSSNSETVLETVFGESEKSSGFGLEIIIMAWAKFHGQTSTHGIDRLERIAMVSEKQYEVIKRLAQV